MVHVILVGFVIYCVLTLASFLIGLFFAAMVKVGAGKKIVIDVGDIIYASGEALKGAIMGGLILGFPIAFYFKDESYHTPWYAIWIDAGIVALLIYFIVMLNSVVNEVKKKKEVLLREVEYAKKVNEYEERERLRQMEFNEQNRLKKIEINEKISSLTNDLNKLISESKSTTKSRMMADYYEKKIAERKAEINNLSRLD